MNKSRLFLSLLAMLFFCHVASSQVKVGIVACPQFNEGFGVRVGSDISIPLSSRWSFVPGVYWSLRNRESYRSVGYSESDGVIRGTKYDYHDKAHFLTIPLHLGVRLAGKPDGDFVLRLLFGPYIAYGMGGTSECGINKDGVKSHTQAGAFDADGRYRARWDYGVNNGLNVLLRKHFLVGVFAEMGFRKIYKPNSVFEDIVGEIFVTNKINIALGLSLGYQF